jgi:hypothetical protein
VQARVAQHLVDAVHEPRLEVRAEDGTGVSWRRRPRVAVILMNVVVSAMRASAASGSARQADAMRQAPIEAPIK